MTHSKLLDLAMAGVLAAGTAGFAGSASARDNNDNRTNEAAMVANAKVTMAQAIATAEGQVGGKAVGAGVENKNGATAFEVEVVKDGQRHKVLVDTQSGQVVKTAMAGKDQNGSDEEDDD